MTQVKVLSAAPDVPEDPDVPDEPELPVPDVPDVPEEPEEPAAPDVPEDPEVPDEPFAAVFVRICPSLSFTRTSVDVPPDERDVAENDVLVIVMFGTYIVSVVVS